MRQRIPFVFSLLVLLIGIVPVAYTQEGRLQIVASNSILADVVRNVVGDAADVTSTMPIGADPHSFEPVPSDLVALAEADIVFINGALFEEQLLEAIENADDAMNIVVASSCVRIIPFDAAAHSHDEHEHEEHEHEEDADAVEATEEAAAGGAGMSALAMLCETHYAEMAAIHEAGHDHEAHADEEHADAADAAAEATEEAEMHEHEHSHGSDVETLGALHAIDCSAGHNHDGEAEHEEDAEHAHVHGEGSCDPHVWTEPHNVMYWTMLIRDTLIELDPANAETYAANAGAYLETLDALAHDFVMPMVETVPEENRILVTNHETLGYFAARYGFEMVGAVIPQGTTAAEPSASDIAALIDQIREVGAPAIFAENTVNSSVAQQIADETGITIALLYSDSLSEADGPASTYLDYVRYNVTTIVEALGGGM